MIYFIQHPEDRYIKIGVAKDVFLRISQLCSEYRSQLILLGICDGSYEKEKALHTQFNPERRFGEWFRPSDRLITYIQCNTYLLPAEDTKTRAENKIPEFIPFNWKNPQKIAERLKLIYLEYGSEAFKTSIAKRLMHTTPDSIETYLAKHGIFLRLPD